jgi:hypothetical protein
MAYYASGDCRLAAPQFEEYVRRKKDPKQDALTALADCQKQLASAKPPTPTVDVEAKVHEAVQAALAERQREEEAARKKEAETYARRAAEEQLANEQQREREAKIAGIKLNLCGLGDDWAFCDASGKLTENAFVRRYRSTTRATDLDWAHRDRKLGPLIATGILAFAVAPALGIGATAYALSQGDCNGGCAATAIGISSTAIGLFLADLIAFSYYAAKRDGNPDAHVIKREPAQAAASRYNYALLDPSVANARPAPKPLPRSKVWIAGIVVPVVLGAIAGGIYAMVQAHHGSSSSNNNQLPAVGQ